MHSGLFGFKVSNVTNFADFNKKRKKIALHLTWNSCVMHTYKGLRTLYTYKTCVIMLLHKIEIVGVILILTIIINAKVTLTLLMSVSMGTESSSQRINTQVSIEVCAYACILTTCPTL